MKSAAFPASSDPLVAFAEHLAQSLASGTFVRLVLSGPGGEEGGAERVLGRLIHLKGVPHLSLTWRYPTRDVVKNLSLSESGPAVANLLGAEFRNAFLGTTEHDWQLTLPKSKKPKLLRHPPASTAAPARQHDQPRRSLLDGTARDWLEGLSVVDRQGRVRPGMADKHRQIDRYLEIVSHLGKECGWDQPEPESGPGQERVIVDMGCGKGYLTFGVWHLLRRAWSRPARVLGVECRPDLVVATNQLATAIGAVDLSFVQGTIQDAQVPRMDALIALHACDTATDDALLRGIEADAQLILVAPCCHKEVRPQLGHPAPLAPLLRHGLLEERLAEWTTDGLRALFLEWAGYRTKVFEFVSSDHTPKNLMIAAVRERTPFSDAAARQRIFDLKGFFGLKSFTLDPLLEKGA